MFYSMNFFLFVAQICAGGGVCATFYLCLFVYLDSICIISGDKSMLSLLCTLLYIQEMDIEMNIHHVAQHLVSALYLLQHPQHIYMTILAETMSQMIGIHVIIISANCTLLMTCKAFCFCCYWSTTVFMNLRNMFHQIRQKMRNPIASNDWTGASNHI